MQVWEQVWEQVRAQVEQVRGQVWQQIDGHVYGQGRMQVSQQLQEDSKGGVA